MSKRLKKKISLIQNVSSFVFNEANVHTGYIHTKKNKNKKKRKMKGGLNVEMG